MRRILTRLVLAVAGLLLFATADLPRPTLTPELAAQVSYRGPFGSVSSTMGSGTGITQCIDVVGGIRCTVGSTQFVAAATTADFTVTTLPANTRVWQADANLTTTFACSATCTTATLSLQLGKGAGGTEYLASIDADAATGWFGDADAEMGTLLTRAAAIQAGTFSTSAQAVVLRLTSGAGNIGNGSVTNLSQGSVTIFMRFNAFQ